MVDSPDAKIVKEKSSPSPSSSPVPVNSPGVASGAAWAAGTKLFDAVEDPGFWLFIFGLLTFWLSSFDPLIAVMIGCFFMFYTTLFIFKGRGLILVLAFFILYVYFGGRFSLESIYTVILPAVLIGLLLRGLLSKYSSGGEGFTAGVGGEVFGLIPILFFFLDIGLIEFLKFSYGIELPILAQNILFFTPWWAYLGLFNTKKTNAFISFVKVLSMVWIFVVIFMLTPMGAYGSQYLPGAEKLLSAKTDFRAEAQSENQFKSLGYCIINGKLVDGLQDCIQIRQRESKWEEICKREQPDDVSRCVSEQKKRFEQGSEVQGTVDTELSLFTTGTITIDDTTFPKQVRALVGDSSTQRQYVAYLKLSNPFAQSLTVRGSCSFKQSRDVVVGEFLLGGSTDSRTVASKEIEVPLSCTPASGAILNGAYTLSFNVIIENLHTTSYLKRAFIHEGYTPEQIAQIRAKIMSTEFSSSADYVSKAPKEFARLNFGMGSTEKDPVVVPGDALIFVSSIESINGAGVKGKLEKVRSYTFNLVDKGFGVTNSGAETCLQGASILVWPGQTQPLTSCFLSLPSQYTDFSQPYIVETFQGELVYDYNLTKEIPIRVDLMDPTTMKPVVTPSGGLR